MLTTPGSIPGEPAGRLDPARLARKLEALQLREARIRTELGRAEEGARQTEARLDAMRGALTATRMQFRAMPLRSIAAMRAGELLQRSETWLVNRCGPATPTPQRRAAGALLRLVRFVACRWRARDSVRRLVAESGLFDPEYYRARHPDLSDSALEPLTHFLRHGGGELRNPNAYFDTAFYLELNPDVQAMGLNPLHHFVVFGAAEGRDPGPDFDTAYYLASNPDVAAAAVGPFWHFFAHGRYEGRAAKAASQATEEARRTPAAHESGLVPSIPSPGTVPRRTAHPAPAGRSFPDHPRLIAFFLPQYHPIPENDEWWGTGFTDWENVVQARPQFEGHAQPHIPADLGFYDLRVGQVRERQAALARAYGIHAFCYYYYWFNGRRLLEQPLDEVLRTGSPDFPFCLCWANESWTRRWDGLDHEILVKQSHSLESDIAFMRDVLPILQDRRYVRFENKPVLLVYRVDQLVDPSATTAAWRRMAETAGLPGLHLCAVETVGFGDPRSRGFDALVEFPPNTYGAPDITGTLKDVDPGFQGHVSDYREIRDHSLNGPPADHLYHHGVMVRWDNTPRRRRYGTIFHHATPEEYETWLRGHVTRASLQPQRDSLIFINAWNEWAEGAHLEPDTTFGHAYLEATARALTLPSAAEIDSAAAATFAAPEPAAVAPARAPARRRAPDERPGLVLAVHDAHRHGAQYLALAIARQIGLDADRRLTILLKHGGELEGEFVRHGAVVHLNAKANGGPPGVGSLSSLLRRLRAERVTDCLCNTVVTGDIAARFKSEGFRVVSLVHELPTLIDTYGHRETCAQIVAHSDRLVFSSRYAREAFNRRWRLDPARTVILPQGLVHTNPYLVRRGWARAAVGNRLGLGEHYRLVVNCAYGDLRKGPDLFLTVARKVLQRRESVNVHFVWIGGFPPELEAWCRHDVEKSGLADRIHLLGFQSDYHLYLAAADVFVLSSREDPFPNVNLSAMEAGVPVVAFAGAGGAPEILGDEAGVVVPYLDVEGMARAVTDLLEDESLRRRLGLRAAELIDQRFGMGRYVSNVLGLFPAISADPAAHLGATRAG